MLPRSSPLRRIIIRFCAGVFSRLVIPPGAIFFLHYIFASSFAFGHKVLYYYIGFLISFSFFTTLRFAVPTPNLSRALLSTLIIFSSAFCFCVRQFYIFFFSRYSQSFSSTSCFRVSILPFTNRGSSPSRCRFYFVFSAARQASLYLPRVSVWENRILPRKIQCVERERKIARWQNVNQLCRVHPLVKPKLSGFIAPICLAAL